MRIILHPNFVVGIWISREILGRTLNENKDQAISEFIKELLILSKQILEKEKLGKMDLISASSLLDEAEERMVWIIPKDIKISKIHELRFGFG